APRDLPSLPTRRSSDLQPCEIIVADDANEDDTRAWLAAQFPDARFECSGERAGPVGFAPTVNRGVRAARYALVYVVNNDVALERSEEHTSELQSRGHLV